jgi:hypothetical protein
MVGGVICASFLGGRLVSKTGRHKRFPVAGLAAATLAYLAMSWAAAHATATIWIEAVLVVMGGFAIGFVMPNLTTAIQNAVERRDLGAYAGPCLRRPVCNRRCPKTFTVSATDALSVTSRKPPFVPRLGGNWQGNF